jgi:hypothetical protein
MISTKHTEIPCFFDDRDKGWGRKPWTTAPHRELIGVE